MIKAYTLQYNAWLFKIPPLKSKSLCEKNAWLFIIICMLKYTKFLQIWRQDLVEDKWTSLQKLYESFMHHIIK